MTSSNVREPEQLFVHRSIFLPSSADAQKKVFLTSQVQRNNKTQLRNFHDLLRLVSR